MGLKEMAEQAFSGIEEELHSISRWMYENPETAFEEYESSRRLSEFLAGNGFDVQYPAYGLDTAFEATVGDGNPRVIICCEYDALPGVGHACGHNVIAVTSLGAGAAIAGLAKELGITVTVLGTPAEEGGGGKVDLLNAGAFEGANAAMMIHPSHRDMLDPKLLAINSYVVEYHGKEAHASFSPHLGVNALDAFVQAYNNVSTLRQQLEPTDRIHCMISHGGVAANVIPAYTRSEWIVRAETGERLSDITEMVKACFEAAARATGCEVTIMPKGHPYVEMVNNGVMTDLFRANSEVLGRPMPTREELGETAAPSSDMGNVSQVVPSIHPGISIPVGGARPHQPEFAAATITPAGHRAIRDGSLAMAHTIIDMAEQEVWDRL
jgi:amidohydrolase